MLGPSPRKKPECNHWRAIPPAKTREKAQKRFREFFSGQVQEVGK
jgi:hypothetical protein